MAIVPLAKDVSIKTIRDVINQKAILIGQARSHGTSYGLYGNDLATGFVQAHIKNISASTINITATLEKASGNVQETFNLAAGATKFLSYTGLRGKTGGFTKARYTGGNPAASYTGNRDHDLSFVENAGGGRSANVDNINIHTKGRNQYYPIVFGNNYSVVNISHINNWNIKDGINQPPILIDTPNSNDNKLSNWRGAQVMQGTALVRKSSLGRYGDDKKQGYIIIRLHRPAFSTGPITVSIRNSTINKDITKTISTGNSTTFKFDNLSGGRIYKIYIKDSLTGTSMMQKYTLSQVAYGGTITHNSYSFNGFDRFLAFTF